MPVPFPDAPAPAASPTAYTEYARQACVGRHLPVELYEGRQADGDVFRYAVRLLSRGLVRAVVLYDHSRRDGARIHAIESDRETVRRWLSTHGVPVLRIGR